MKLRQGDVVKVVAGPHRGQKGKAEKLGKVLRVDRDKDRIVVEGVNRRVRHTRPNPQAGQQGGRVEREMPIAAANVMFYCDRCKKGARLRVRRNESGGRVRVCARCGAEHP